MEIPFPQVTVQPLHFVQSDVSQPAGTMDAESEKEVNYLNCVSVLEYSVEYPSGKIFKFVSRKQNKSYLQFIGL